MLNAQADEMCRKGLPCSGLGQCAADPDLGSDRCVASSHADCQQSEVCSEAARCRGFDGVCTVGEDDCKPTSGCKTMGWCTARNGACVVGSDADCRQLRSCKLLGECSAAADPRPFGKCVIGKDEDCLRLEDCQSMGHCSAKGGKCVVAKEADCRLHYVGCKQFGACTAMPSEGSSGRCKVTKDEDCRQSLACKVRGECRAVGPACAK